MITENKTVYGDWFVDMLNEEKLTYEQWFEKIDDVDQAMLWDSYCPNIDEMNDMEKRVDWMFSQVLLDHYLKVGDIK